MPYSPTRTKILVAGALGIASLALLLMRLLHWSIGERFALGIAAMLVTCSFAWTGFLHQDEIQRANGMRVWYWGSNLGALGAAILMLLLIVSGSVPGLADAVFRWQHPKAEGYFALGFMLPILLQMAGFLVVWLALKFQKRGSA